MREIKFKFWSPSLGKMFYDYRLNAIDYSTVMGHWKSAEPYLPSSTYAKNFPYLFDATKLQYTGLKDKNGTEIYDQDLVKVCFELYPNSEWSEEMIAIYRVNIGPFQITMNMMKLIKPDMMIDHIHLEASDYYAEDGVLVIEPKYRSGEQIRAKGTVEVIGNIYENPKLLVKEETQ